MGNKIVRFVDKLRHDYAAVIPEKCGKTRLVQTFSNDDSAILLDIDHLVLMDSTKSEQIREALASENWSEYKILSYPVAKSIFERTK
jgi:hypothetical protein